MRTSIKLQYWEAGINQKLGKKTTQAGDREANNQGKILCGFIGKVWGLGTYQSGCASRQREFGDKDQAWDVFFLCSCKCCRWQQRQWMLCADLCIQACVCVCVCAYLHFWEHTDCWYELQMARAGNRLGKRNPGSPKSLSLFWTFVTTVHTDHNSVVFCSLLASFRIISHIQFFF